MPPRVTIEYDSNVYDAYEAILHDVDQRYHSYQTTFPVYPTTEEEYGELETAANYAAHAGDLYNSEGVHIERLLA